MRRIARAGQALPLRKTSARPRTRGTRDNVATWGIQKEQQIPYTIHERRGWVRDDNKKVLCGGGGGRVALKLGEDFAQSARQFVAGNLAATELDAEMVRIIL